jgi:hypothetical protein
LSIGAPGGVLHPPAHHDVIFFLLLFATIGFDIFLYPLGWGSVMMSERLLDKGCGEGFAGSRDPFRVSRIGDPGLPGSGVPGFANSGFAMSGDGHDPISNAAIDHLSFRPLVGISCKADGSESADDILAYAHAVRYPREYFGSDTRSLTVAINWCDNRVERIALDASAVT